METWKKRKSRRLFKISHLTWLYVRDKEESSLLHFLLFPQQDSLIVFSSMYCSSTFLMSIAEQNFYSNSPHFLHLGMREQGEGQNRSNEQMINTVHVPLQKLLHYSVLHSLGTPKLHIAIDRERCFHFANAMLHIQLRCVYLGQECSGCRYSMLDVI